MPGDSGLANCERMQPISPVYPLQNEVPSRSRERAFMTTTPRLSGAGFQLHGHNRRGPHRKRGSWILAAQIRPQMNEN